MAPPLDRLSSPDISCATDGNFHPVLTTQRTDTVPVLSTQDGNTLATFVSTYAFIPSGGSSVAVSANPTFASNDSPPYDPGIPQDFGSNDGRVAANSLLGMETLGATGLNPLQTEAQMVTQTLGQHKNDPQFLQQYLGTLGAKRTASVFSYAASLANVQTPFDYTGGTASPKQLRQEYQNVADALSALVKSNNFSQGDMDKFVAQFAKDNTQMSFFAKDVLGNASPQVNQMFYESAKNYALQNSSSSAGQSMAAYAIQALSQTSNPLPQLQSLPNDQLSTLVKAAMKGEAAYGNPASIEEFAKTGSLRTENGQGAPLTGLSRLMFDAAYSDVGDQFARAPLSPPQAQDLQTRLFQTAIDTLQSDPSVKSFYNQSTSMKDALAVEFQQGYSSIVNAYSGPDGELSSAGMSAIREFFADAVFSPPPSSYALGAVQTIGDKLSAYVAKANSAPPNARPSQKDVAYAESLGEQAQAMAAGLKESFTSILNDSAKGDQDANSLIRSVIAIGGGVVGLGGPAPSIGATIVGQALILLVNSRSGSGPANVQEAVQKLASHGIDVSQYDSGAFQDLSTKMLNGNFRTPLQLGMDNAGIVLYDS